MRKSTLKAIRDHAIADSPRESCGLVILENGKELYIPCRNLSPEANDTFVLDPKDFAAAEDRGEILMVVHSHPNESARPSEGDLVSIEAHGLPFLIVSVYKDLITGEMNADDYTITEPSGYEAPLIGRRWAPPTLDCYSLIRDLYSRELGITVPDFEIEKRAGKWWEDKDNSSLYLDHFEEAGFVRVDWPPQKYDVIFMEVGSKAGPNHAGIYLGDNIILHHLYGRLSERVPYGGYWQGATRMIVRHRELCGKES